MVRAAVSGAIDYSRSDPLDKTWRIRHRLLIAEMQRRENQHMLEYLHQHWCAYVSHGGLQEGSFDTVKKTAGELLTDLQNTIFPWQTENKENVKSAPEKGKIDAESQKLVERYKTWRAKKDNNDG